MLDFLPLRLFDSISVPLSFWHHALRLPLVRRVGGRAVSPVACSALACEERHDISACGGGVPVCGQSGISVTEGGTGDTSFFTVRMDMRPIRRNK